ncbi:MAG: HNH endonuclease, partial [Mariniphaga sp.]|nr:HNH endonuclease [Mariniphaga sp.]
AKGSGGRMFEYINTNFRTQNSFAGSFLKFQEIEGKPRDQWPRQSHHGQEVHKQLVVTMLQSKLFKKEVNGLFSKTNKGSLYAAFIDSQSLDEGRWLINYLFLLNGYYANLKNYITCRVREDLLGYLSIVDGLDQVILLESAKELLAANSFEKIIRSTFFYIHSFYNDSDFLIQYIRASSKEKEDLAKYIEKNLKEGTFECCISKKYELGGNFNKSMLHDETRVFLLTLLFVFQSENINLDNVYNIFVENFKQNISDINEKDILGYLYQNRNIFNPVFSDVLELEELDATATGAMSYEEVPMIDVKDAPEDYIDETSESGRQRIQTSYNLRKKQARIQGDYKCGLEVLNNCKPIYFTSRVNGRNYLELHHLIPRAFRNDFSYSIEVLANYVTLCPRCHKQIHLATDGERTSLINALYGERNKRLETVGIGLELNQLHEYYKIGT